MQEERTSNGILYTWELAGPHGAAFLLFPDPHHTKQDIQKAKQELKDNQDVVAISVADDDDRDYIYKSKIFRDPRTKDLKWFEIQQDEKLIRTERRKGTTPEDFVTTHVLPFIEQVRKANFEKFGVDIL